MIRATSLQVAGLCGVLLVVAWWGSRARPITSDPPSKGGSPRASLTVPRAEGDVTIDGDLEEPAWKNHAASTGPFVAKGGGLDQPFTQLRAIYSPKYLYLALFAADTDIRGGHETADGPIWLSDSFRLEFTKDGVSYEIDVSPTGVITDARRGRGGAWDYSWQSGAKTAMELEGTADKPDDHDKDWVIEMAIPLSSIGMDRGAGERIDFWARRCDRPSNQCLSWGEGTERGEIVLL